VTKSAPASTGTQLRLPQVKNSGTLKLLRNDSSVESSSLVPPSSPLPAQ
jgi:hypothetical protein